MSPKTQVVSFTIPKGDNVLETFDGIIKPFDRSSTLRKIIRYMNTQPSFLISICQMTDDQLIQIQAQNVQQIQE